MRNETGAGVLDTPRPPSLPVDRAVLARILHLFHLYVYIYLNTLRLEEVASLCRVCTHVHQYTYMRTPGEVSACCGISR